MPAVVVSPWVAKGSVFHAVPFPAANGSIPGQYEHSSIVSTVVHKLFQPLEGHAAPQYLTKRDEWAATFEWIFDQLSAPRSDCPTTTPTPQVHRALFPETLPKLDGKGPLSELQEELMALVAGVTDDKDFWNFNLTAWTEGAAGSYCQERLSAYFSK